MATGLPDYMAAERPTLPILGEDQATFRISHTQAVDADSGHGFRAFLPTAGEIYYLYLVTCSCVDASPGVSALEIKWDTYQAAQMYFDRNIVFDPGVAGALEFPAGRPGWVYIYNLDPVNKHQYDWFLWGLVEDV